MSVVIGRLDVVAAPPSAPPTPTGAGGSTGDNEPAHTGPSALDLERIVERGEARRRRREAD